MFPKSVFCVFSEILYFWYRFSIFDFESDTKKAEKKIPAFQ